MFLNPCFIIEPSKELFKKKFFFFSFIHDKFFFLINLLISLCWVLVVRVGSLVAALELLLA